MGQAHSSNKRYRGFVLTNEGLQKLNNCIQKLEAQTRMRYGASAIARKVQLVESDGIHPITVRKILQCQTGVDYRSIDHVFQALQLSLSEGDYAHADLCKSNKSSKSKWANISSSPNHINIPDISNFYGRAKEIAQLESKIIYDRTKVVALFGTLGIGKTATAIKLTYSLKSRFEFVIWKSLRQAPTLEELLISVLKKFPANSNNKNNLPTSLCSLIDLLLEKLQHHHCLLIFDGFETIMKHDEQNSAYNDFLHILLESKHQSNVILTSRNKPNLFGILEEKNIYSTRISNLQFEDIIKIFGQQDIYQGSTEDWINLINYYGGNPLALKTVSNHVLQYFEGNIARYLKELTASKFILKDFHKLLIEELKNLSGLEKVVIHKLASYTHKVSLSQLRLDLNEPKIEPYLLNILDNLNSCALIEQYGAYFKLQPFIAECILHLNPL